MGIQSKNKFECGLGKARHEKKMQHGPGADMKVVNCLGDDVVAVGIGELGGWGVGRGGRESV